MAESQLLQALGCDIGGFLQPSNDLLLVVERGLLRAHDAEDDDLVFGQVTQGLEVTAARIVVLEEVGVNVQLLEEDLRDGLVAARGEPFAAVVAAAEVDADLHVCGALGDGLVDELGIFAGEGGEVLVAVFGLLAHVRVAEVGEVGVVELDEAAAGVVEAGEFLLVHAGEVLEELVEVGVGFDGDGGAAAAEVDHGGGGDAHFGGCAAAMFLDLLLEELEVFDLDGLGVAELAGHCKDGRRETVWADETCLALDLNARQVLEEVQVEVCAAELAICDGTDAVLDLLLCDIGDCGVLNLAQFVEVRLLVRDGLAGVQDGLGTQERPDVVGAVDTVWKRHYV